MYINNSQKLLDVTPRQVIRYIRRKFLNEKKVNVKDYSKLSSIFVLSTGRVGSQTLAALCGLAKDYLVYHEPKPLLFGLSKAAYDKYSEGTSEIFLESFLTARKVLFKYCLKVGKRYMETGPHVTFLAPVILEALPQTRFIHLVRDPRDVVRSGMRRRWYDGHRFDKTRIVPAPSSEDGQQWASYSPFQKNLWLWNETNRWILDFCSGLSNEKVLILHAKDMFDAYEKELLKLFAFLGSAIPPERKILRVLGQKLNAQKQGVFPNQADWSEEMNQRFIEMALETARALGYGQ